MPRFSQGERISRVHISAVRCANREIFTNPTINLLLYPQLCLKKTPPNCSLNDQKITRPLPKLVLEFFHCVVCYLFKELSAMCAPLSRRVRLLALAQTERRKGCGAEGRGTSNRGVRCRTHGASASHPRRGAAPSGAGNATGRTPKTPVVQLPASRFAQEAQIH